MIEYQKYLEWTGDKEAARFISMLAQVSQIADDFVDGDKDRNSEDMVALLSICLVEIPANPFYQTYSQWFQPIFLAALAQWNASNEWAKGSKQEKIYGFVYRETLEIAIPLAAMLLRGREHGLRVAKDVNSYYHQGPEAETFEQWAGEQDVNWRRTGQPDDDDHDRAA